MIILHECQLREKRDRVIQQAEETLKNLKEILRELDSNPEEAFYAIRFSQISHSPLGGSMLTLFEQFTQTSHDQGSFAAAEYLLKQLPECGGLYLAPRTESGTDIWSLVPLVVEAEVFATVDTNYNRKLKKDSEKLCDLPSQNRFVFFYSPNSKHGFRCYRVPKFPEIEVKVYSLNKDELLGRKPIDIPSPD